MLLALSDPSSDLLNQINAADVIVEAFGNARTLENANASRYGRYTELQFTQQGRLYGMKTLNYWLERDRTVGISPGERNFHIFYYLLAGATPEERRRLRIRKDSQNRYLRQRTTGTHPSAIQDDEAQQLAQIRIAMQTIGLSRWRVAQVFQLLATILHLGDLEFAVDRVRDVVVVKDAGALGHVAALLGVPASKLEHALSCKTKEIEGELCTVFLDPGGASDNRDALAKMLYSLLFSKLIEHINQRLHRDDTSTFIGLLDLPGPQNLTNRMNSFNQFCE